MRLFSNFEQKRSISMFLNAHIGKCKILLKKSYIFIEENLCKNEERYLHTLFRMVHNEFCNKSFTKRTTIIL